MYKLKIIILIILPMYFDLFSDEILKNLCDSYFNFLSHAIVWHTVSSKTSQYCTIYYFNFEQHAFLSSIFS